MKRLFKFLAPVAVIAGAIGVWVVLDATKPEPEKKEEVTKAPSLFVESVQRQEVTLKIRTQAEVKANTEVNVISQVSGMVQWVSQEYIEGGQFKAGEAILKIDDADYKLALKRAEARVAEAKTRVEQVEADAEVARRQLRGVKNPSALALKKPQLAEAKANLKAADADLAQAQLNLTRTKISLPFDGRLKSIAANIGQYISQGSNVGRAFATAKVKLRLPLTDRQLASLNLPIGFVATQERTPLVKLSARFAGKDQSWDAQLTRVDAALDQSTRLVYATAEVNNPYELSTPLAVGMYVSAEVYGDTIEQALVVPRAALRTNDRIYVVDEENRLDVREVNVIDKSPAGVLIEGAVQEGEKVIVSPLRNPTQGMAINILERNEQSKVQTATVAEDAANG